MHDPLDDDDRTDAVPKVTPNYADDEMRELGERLAALYYSRDVKDAPEPPGLREEIAKIRGKMRRGPRLHAGEFLKDGRYRLLSREHGPAGGDQFWAAYDRKSGDPVLVRIFHGEWADDPKQVEAFRARGRKLMELDHESIGQVLDADRSEDGFVFLVTRMAGATTLADAPVEAADAIQLAIEVAQALGHAHERGVVHFAVRPDNVRLDPDGKAWLVGFSVEPDARADASSLYRAPETTERGYTPQPAADVYALGMTLMAALNGGDLPFWVLRDPARLLEKLPTTPGVKGVVKRATDWDLRDRYADVSGLTEELVADVGLVERLGERARTKGRYATAAEHYETLLRAQPHRGVELRTLLGRIYTELGTYDRAFQHLLAALERTPDVEALFDPLRVVASRTGEWARLAQALWTQARARDPGRRVILRTELARINQQELGNAVAAAETWSQVLADHRLPAQAATALRALQELARIRADWRGFVDYGRELLNYVTGEEKSRVEYAVGRAHLEHLHEDDAGLAYIDAAEATGYSEIDLGPRLQVLRAQRGQWQRVIHLMVQQAGSQDITEASPTLLRAGIIASSVHLEDEARKVYHALLERAPRHVVALRHLARLHHRAHEHDLAVKFYERLWETYRGKESEEPEASERAADCTGYAQILIRRGQVDAAAARLDEALRLNANHVPALQLAGPLVLARGEIPRAQQIFERLLSLFKSVELSQQKMLACLGMGDLAWVSGRLTAAMGWYNRALELDPFSVAGWWGLAKVALAARAGHPGTERAPWVMATPRRFTAWEALARLFSGLLSPSAMRAWLERSALGRAFLDPAADGGNPSAIRLASAVVDVMVRNGLVGPELFRRLGDAAPEWAEPIDEVARLVLADGAAGFHVARSYGWTALAESTGPFTDFGDLEVRSVLPMDVATAEDPVEPHLGDAEGWDLLVSGQRPPSPSPFTMIEPERPVEAPRFSGPVGALVRDGEAWVVLGADRAAVSIGSDPGSDLVLVEPSVSPRHARLYRQGSRVYLEAEEGARLQIDGEDRRLWRVLGGERVTLGEIRLQFQAFADSDPLPPPAPPTRDFAPPPPAPPAAAEVTAPLPEPEPESAAPVAPEADPSEATEPPAAPVAEAPAETPEAPLPADAAGAPVADEGADPVLREPTAPIRTPAPSTIPPGFLDDVGADPETDKVDVPASVLRGEEPPEEVPLSVPPTSSKVAPPAAPPPELPADAPLLEVPAKPIEIPNLGESTGPIPPIPLPAVSYEPEATSEPVPMPTDVVGEPTAPIPAAPAPSTALSSSTGAHSDLDDEPPSDEERVHALRGRGAVSSQAPLSDVPEDLSEDAAHTPAPAPSASPPPYPAPSLPGMSLPPGPRFAGPTDGTLVPAEEDVPSSAPAWLRQALAQEERNTPAPTRGRVAGPTAPPPPAEAMLRADDAPNEPLALGDTTESAVDASDGPTEADVGALPQVFDEPPPPRKGTTPVPADRRTASTVPAPTRTAAAPSVAPPAAPPSAVPSANRRPATLKPQPVASIEFVSGPERGRRVNVNDVLTIGSGPKCGISIPGDTRLSAVHCRVEKAGGGYWLRDEQSATGTVVNGQSITDHELKGGEVIMVGRTVLRFRVEEPG